MSDLILNGNETRNPQEPDGFLTTITSHECGPEIVMISGSTVDNLRPLHVGASKALFGGCHDGSLSPSSSAA